MNLARLVDQHPDDAPAVVDERGATGTYGELRAAAAQVRARLAAAGVGPADRVAIVAANSAAFVAGYLAVLGAGAVAVPLNPASPVAELRRQMAAAEVAAVCPGPGGGHAGAAAALAGDGRPDGTAPPAVVDLTVPADDGGGSEPPPDVVDRAPDDLAVLLFTAGTASSPRPAMLTHGNLLANLDQVRRHPGRALDPGDTYLGVLPLCHIFGLNVMLGEALLAGASLLMVERFDPSLTLELIARHHVTIVMGPPTMYAELAAAASGADRAGLAAVRLASSGASALTGEVADACRDRLGLVLRQGYGLTEAAPVVTSAVLTGPAPPGFDRCAASRASSCAWSTTTARTPWRATPGEIWVRGPQRVRRATGSDPDATAAALTPDGWLRTGDVAVVDDDGDLYLVDRVKDLIIVSGFNVYPAEVEEILRAHPGVADAAVVGAADALHGESIHAFVVPVDAAAAPTTADLVEFCRERLAHYKCPTEVTFVASLPYGLGGKLLRRTLRAGLSRRQPGRRHPGRRRLSRRRQSPPAAPAGAMARPAGPRRPDGSGPTGRRWPR